MKIALDTFGSDNAPCPEVEGAINAIHEQICDKIYLVGKKKKIEAELQKYYYDKEKIEIVPSEQVITSTENPLKEIKRKKNSSLQKAVELVNDEIADVLVSAGSTGAVMATSLLTFGRIHGILRPAIAIQLPTLKDPVVVLDVGANVDCSVKNLVQFAEMGSIYSSYLTDKKRPKIALLNIGEEKKKGNEITKSTHKELEKNESINFVGNIEGKDILKGNVNVIICDGFVGNIMLKTVEGVAFSLFEILKKQFNEDWIAKIGAFLSFPAFRHFKKKIDYTEYGGAFLLGLNDISIIAHGRSNAKAFFNALKFASISVESQFLLHMKEYYNRSN